MPPGQKSLEEHTHWYSKIGKSFLQRKWPVGIFLPFLIFCLLPSELPSFQKWPSISNQITLWITIWLLSITSINFWWNDSNKITPSPHVTRFPLARFPFTQSLPMLGEFRVSGIISTVPLMQFLCNADFFRNQNAPNVGNSCIYFVHAILTPKQLELALFTYFLLRIKTKIPTKFWWNKSIKEFM